MLSLIAAVSRNNVIGLNNSLPWYLPEDLQHFKKVTLGKTVIMGRKTFESIGRPLLNRESIVVSNSYFFDENEGCLLKSFPGYTAARSLEAAIDFAVSTGNEIFLIGGATLYKEALENNYIAKVHLTVIHHTFEGDTFLDLELLKDYNEISKEDYRTPGGLSYSFKVLERA